MDALKQLVDKYHVPDLNTKPGSVYMLFADGELVLTKSGELFGMRTFHSIMAPVVTNPHPTWERVFPQEINNYYCCFIAEHDHANILRAEIARLKETA